MSKIGLLVLSSKNVHRIENLLNQAKSLTSKLYVRLKQRNDELIGKVYLTSSVQCPQVDVRVLCKNEIPKDCLVIDEDDACPETSNNCEPRYKRVVLGGTFDRLHNGHKVLLTKAAEIASEKVVVGVTEKNMLIKKSLYEMIEPVDKRMQKVVEFVEDITSGVTCYTEPIVDPFGPSTRMQDLEAIVVSRETVKGADAVNKKRLEKGMSQLDVIIVELVEGSDDILKETKISSSSRRRQDLGKLLRPPNEHDKSIKPYIIGLTGGIASGKSNIGKYLKEKHQFDVIDCDKLAHSCYVKGSQLSVMIAKTFGEDVVIDGVVDRKKLGSIVFKDSKKLRQLSELVWPVVKDKAMEQIRSSKAKVAVIEAAALIEAGWHRELPEVWTVFVPPEEAIQRVIRRDNVGEEQAKQRLESQITNKERLDNSNVVLCSLWEYEQTRAQVDRAVNELLERI